MDDAQLQAIFGKWTKDIDKKMTDMKLRQWCVEQAIKVEPKGDGDAVVTLASDMMKFISDPFADVFKDRQ